MKKRMLMWTMLLAVVTSCGACSHSENEEELPFTPETEQPTPEPADDARTLVVYYSFTNNVKHIVDELATQIDTDVLQIEPAQEGVDYAANNYVIGSAQIAAIRNRPDDAASYPDIKPVDVDLAPYDVILVATPLWWSQMAAPMQAFLFRYGGQMTDKRIGLIVSSASSGISGVESDARRLIPDGKFQASSLWIRSAQTSGCRPLVAEWLTKIGYTVADE